MSFFPMFFTFSFIFLLTKHESELPRNATAAKEHYRDTNMTLFAQLRGPTQASSGVLYGCSLFGNRAEQGTEVRRC